MQGRISRFSEVRTMLLRWKAFGLGRCITVPISASRCFSSVCPHPRSRRYFNAWEALSVKSSYRPVRNIGISVMTSADQSRSEAYTIAGGGGRSWQNDWRSGSTHLTAKLGSAFLSNELIAMVAEVCLKRPSEHEPAHSILDSALAGRAHMARFSGFEGNLCDGANCGPRD
jgi:hypothetical protein